MTDVITLWHRETVIKSSYDLPGVEAESLGNPKKRRNIDWVSGLHLLPVAETEAERDHIFLGVALFLSELLDARAQVAIEALVMGRMAAFHSGALHPRAYKSTTRKNSVLC